MKYHVNDRVRLKKGGEYDIAAVHSHNGDELYSVKHHPAGWYKDTTIHYNIIEGKYEDGIKYWNVTEDEIECVILPSIPSFKFSVGETIKSKPRGFHIYDSSRWVQTLEKDLQSKNCNITGIIGERKFENGYNWYRLVSGDSWITEEGLEIAPQQDSMPHKIGTLLDCQGKLCYFAGKAALVDQFIVEMKEDGIGWQRDRTVPSDYVSIGADKYFYYNSSFKLAEEKLVIQEISTEDSKGNILKEGDYIERISGSFGGMKTGDVLKITRLYGLLADGVTESGKTIDGVDTSKFIKVDGFKKKEEPVISSVIFINDYLLNTKIWIGDNRELSKLVQEALFQKGFAWGNSGKQIKYTDATSLFMWDDYKLAHDSCNREKFSRNSKREISPADLGIVTIPIFEDKPIHFLWSNPVSGEKTLQDPVLIKRKKKKYSLL